MVGKIDRRRLFVNSIIIAISFSQLTLRDDKSSVEEEEISGVVEEKKERKKNLLGACEMFLKNERNDPNASAVMLSIIEKEKEKVIEYAEKESLVLTGCVGDKDCFGGFSKITNFFASSFVFVHNKSERKNWIDKANGSSKRDRGNRNEALIIE